MMTFLSDFHLDGPFGAEFEYHVCFVGTQKGKVEDIKDFRLISLVSCINKLLVKILVCDAGHNPHC